MTQIAATAAPGARGTGSATRLREDPPAGPCLPGFSVLEALIIELAWAADGDLDTGEICDRAGQHRMSARSTAETAARPLPSQPGDPAGQQHPIHGQGAR